MIPALHPSYLRELARRYRDTYRQSRRPGYESERANLGRLRVEIRACKSGAETYTYPGDPEVYRAGGVDTHGHIPAPKVGEPWNHDISRNPDAAPGLGRLYYMDSHHRFSAWGSYGRTWIYKDPRGEVHHVAHWGTEPPPLPKLNPHKCGCWEGAHRCSSCGNDTWIEYHGNADGACSFCYARG